jgi:hypothetical protein
MTAGDQRRVEVLVARLLADDVLVAQRQRDLAGCPFSTGRRGEATTAIAERTIGASSSPSAAGARARARAAARAGGRSRSEVRSCAIIGPSFQGRRQLALEVLERAVVAHHDVARSPSPPG